MAKLEVNVWSDVACPWCWVGLQRYKKAVAKVAKQAKIQVETKFHPYLIDPRTKASGEDYESYNKRRWGSDAWTVGLRASGKPDGAKFRDWKWWPNTLKAHQLINLAEQQGVAGQDAVEALFQATYEEGLNVSEKDVLDKVAASLGVVAGKGALPSEEDVLEADRYAKNVLNISGVPHFVIGNGDRRAVLHGAQSTHALHQALEKEISKLAAH